MFEDLKITVKYYKWFKKHLPFIGFIIGLILVWGLQIFFWLPVLTRVLLAIAGSFIIGFCIKIK